LYQLEWLVTGWQDDQVHEREILRKYPSWSTPCIRNITQKKVIPILYKCIHPGLKRHLTSITIISIVRSFILNQLPDLPQIVQVVRVQLDQQTYIFCVCVLHAVSLKGSFGIRNEKHCHMRERERETWVLDCRKPRSRIQAVNDVVDFVICKIIKQTVRLGSSKYI
jgi:hypothetical protein